MNLQQLLSSHLAGRAFYSHSAGERYHYRGTISNVRLVDAPFRGESLCVDLTRVETMEGDIDGIWESRFRPGDMTGTWRPYDDFAYRAPSRWVTLSEHSEGIEISFREVGVLFIPIATDS